MKPILAATASSAATDEQLVDAARAGSDQAVEALYRRYRERITAYARGIVDDSGRAEDIVQETFMSAFRSLRATDREIAFKPWIYQIAKNACIDQLRRQGRTEEISIDSDDFKPQHEGRLSQATPTTHKAVTQREDMHQLAQAFSGLPRSQHEVLVLRELEGLSYEEIGTRLDLSRSAVESMLFRARRGLKDEYEEIATGERCRRTHALIAAVSEGVATARDRRAISRHTQLCAGCRHDAIVAGLGSLVTGGRRHGKLRSAIDKAAALVPFPFLRRGSGSMSNFSSIAGAEQATTLAKAIAAIVATAVIAGGGIVGHNSPSVSDALAGTTAGGGSGIPGLTGAPGAPGPGASGAPGLVGGLAQGSQQASPGVFSPSLLPVSPAGGGGGGQGGGLIGGLSAPGGSTAIGAAPTSGLGLPTVGNIQLPGTSGSGGGGGTLLDTSKDLGGALPKLDTSKVTDTISQPTQSLPLAPSTSTPSLPSTDTTVPTLPSAPTAPSTSDVTSTTTSALGTATGLATGATGAAGTSLPKVPGL
jgi:RNA polymerase sigma factor (sigma-70 family)